MHYTTEKCHCITAAQDTYSRHVLVSLSTENHQLIYLSASLMIASKNYLPLKSTTTSKQMDRIKRSTKKFIIAQHKTMAQCGLKKLRSLFPKPSFLIFISAPRTDDAIMPKMVKRGWPLSHYSPYPSQCYLTASKFIRLAVSFEISPKLVYPEALKVVFQSHIWYSNELA